MPIVHFPDAAGKTVTLRTYGDKGHHITASDFPQEVIENIHNVTVVEDDVLLCSYPKTGCHWLWEMARMLQAGTSEVEKVEKEQYMMESRSQSQLSQLPSPRILNTHVLFHQLPQAAKDGKVKVLFIYRNPKDVAVSLYHHVRKIPCFQYEGEFGDYLTELFLKGRVEAGLYFTYTRDWERVMDSRPNLPIFALSYEELQADTFSKAKELARFLGSSADDDTIHDIVDKCSFGSMLDRKGKHWTEKLGSPVMYRKGKVGDWKNWFTVAHSEMMDQIVEKEMEGSRFKFQYTL
ncbi:sulfotransferase 6B1-like [Babylonia areolata]|uniref:sulfotransferase 6B1-like n=1 Tax=Babylonia areolata TaxID=304850 RepID=UPI003FCF6563